MSKIKVSIIVPTFNHGSWLKDCLDSIVEQKTDFNFEILVGDDGSTDGITQTILKDYESRYPDLINATYHKSNIGPDLNVFCLLDQANGDYIARLDGDDLMLPGKLQIQAEFLDKNEDYSLVCHQMIILTNTNNKIYRTQYKGTLNTIDLVKKGCVFSNSSIMYRRNACRIKNRLFNRPVVDFLSHIDRSLHGLCYVLPDFLGIYRQGTGISSSMKWVEPIAIAYMDAYNYAIENGVDYDIVKKAQINKRLHFALKALRIGNSKMFREWIILNPDDKLSHIKIKYLPFVFLHKVPFICKILINILKMLKKNV